MSEGCRHCYAERLAGTRLRHSPRYAATTVLGAGGPRWTGVVNCHEDRLTDPLSCRKRQSSMCPDGRYKIFVCDMSDLFHQAVPMAFILRVYETIERCPEIDFQILTKRPEQMASVADWWCANRGGLPSNAWFGTSVENQKTAGERIPHLLKCEAAVRFLSVEPMLEGFNIALLDPLGLVAGFEISADEHESETAYVRDGARTSRIQWAIFGAESGPGARPCDDEWIRDGIAQCRAAGVAPFVKQRCDAKGRRIPFEDWPEDLKVREWPVGQAARKPRMPSAAS